MLFDIPAAAIAEDHASGAVAAVDRKVKTQLAKAANALTILPPLTPDTDIHYVSGAEWSTHDLVFHIIRQVGPVALTGATWSMSEPACLHFVRALQAGDITHMEMLFDWRVQVRCPEAVSLSKANNVRFRVTTCHAKVCVLQAAEMWIAIVGSANFTNNPRIEAGVISTSEAVARFHREWIRAEMANSAPFGIDMRKARQDGRK